MKKNIIITTMMMLMCGAAAVAQPTGAQAQEEASTSSATGGLSFLATIDEQASASSNVERSADKFVADKGWNYGLNEDTGTYVAKGYAVIKTKPTDKNFETDRSLAFLEAMSEAKKDIARFYSQRIKTSLEHVFNEPMSADAQIRKLEEESVDPSIFKKYKDLVNAKLDRELKKEGITYASPRAKVILEGVLSNSSLTSSIERTAMHHVGALVVSKIYESDGEIAVVTYYSSNTLLLAGAINGKPVVMPNVPKRKGASVEQWIQGLKIEPLYLSKGVQVTTDSKGNIVLVAYGLSTARSRSGDSKKAAKNKAEMEAAAAIRRFAGELVVTTDSKEDVLNAIELDDGSNESLSDIETSYTTKTSLKAESLNIPGITRVRDWDFVDPRSNTLVCGVVSIWSIKTGNAAIKEEKRTKPLVTPAGGFKGSKPVIEVKKAEPKAKVNESYSSESAEGEYL